MKRIHSEIDKCNSDRERNFLECRIEIERSIIFRSIVDKIVEYITIKIKTSKYLNCILRASESNIGKEVAMMLNRFIFTLYSIDDHKHPNFHQEFLIPPFILHVTNEELNSPTSITYLSPLCRELVEEWGLEVSLIGEIKGFVHEMLMSYFEEITQSKLPLLQSSDTTNSKPYLLHHNEEGDEGMMWEVGYGGDVCYLNGERLEELMRRYAPIKGKNTSKKEEDLLLDEEFIGRLFNLLLRYSTLNSSSSSLSSSGEMRYSNSGYHISLHPSLFDLFSSYLSLTISHEGFSSPLNVSSSSSSSKHKIQPSPQYFSSQYDVDKFFGSRGSFFEISHVSNLIQDQDQDGGVVIEINPPFVEEIMVEAANKILHLLSNSSSSSSNHNIDDKTKMKKNEEEEEDLLSNEDEKMIPLSFLIVLPAWENPISLSFQLLTSSPYFIPHSLIRINGEKKVFMSGEKHQIPIQPINEEQEQSNQSSPSSISIQRDVHLFILQNLCAQKKYPISNQSIQHLNHQISLFPTSS